MFAQDTAVREQVGQWTLDPYHTQAEFAVKHMMFATVRGRFREVGGTLLIDHDEPWRSKVEVRIETSSIDTGIAARDQHLRSEDFFEVDRFPGLTFESTGVEGWFEAPGDRFRIRGHLTIRDVTLPVTLEVHYDGKGVDPDGVERLAFSAETRINRRDFGLLWNQALETGGVLVGDEVRITLQVQAIPSLEQGPAS